MTGWFVLNLNPEPWRIGPVSVGRGGGGKLFPVVGRDQQLAAFQEAVRELLGPQTMIDRPVKLTFYFWREQAAYTGKSEKQIRKHQVDATNMQKATEDALQGVFFDNDSLVRDIRSVIVEQGADIKPRIVIHVEECVTELWFENIPADVLAKLDDEPELFDDNVWPPRA